MARSAHSFVRGSTRQFYEWFDAAAAPGLPEGPPIWICGDGHVGNLGPVADSSGAVHIHVRDLDQMVIGNPALDIVRLALSLASAARGSSTNVEESGEGAHREYPSADSPGQAVLVADRGGGSARGGVLGAFDHATRHDGQCS